MHPTNGDVPKLHGGGQEQYSHPVWTYGCNIPKLTHHKDIGIDRVYKCYDLPDALIKRINKIRHSSDFRGLNPAISGTKPTNLQ